MAYGTSGAGECTLQPRSSLAAVMSEPMALIQSKPPTVCPAMAMRASACGSLSTSGRVTPQRFIKATQP